MTFYNCLCHPQNPDSSDDIHIFFNPPDDTQNHYKKRAMGIEPTSEAWEASILPLDYARITVITKYFISLLI